MKLVPLFLALAAVTVAQTASATATCVTPPFPDGLVQADEMTWLPCLPIVEIWPNPVPRRQRGN